jgi:D-beta-D-heptose 7-phosphate kinase/D-beta-D-heptose 1-phosphate adenosyltransferase
MNILVIGDGCIDEYRHGVITRMNPESAAPLMRYDDSEERPGMALNVAQNLKSLGADVTLSTSENMCRKIRYINRRTGEQLLRVDIDVEAVPYEFSYDYDEYDAIVISDYNKGFVTDETVKSLRKEFSGPIYMDTKKTNLGNFPGIYFKINERELFEATSLPEYDKLIVTYGSKGCGYKDNVYNVKAIDVVDVCGAGDVFLAAMVVKHLETNDMDIALNFANEKASLSCKSLGTVCVS